MIFQRWKLKFLVTQIIRALPPIIKRCQKTGQNQWLTGWSVKVLTKTAWLIWALDLISLLPQMIPMKEDKWIGAQNSRLSASKYHLAHKKKNADPRSFFYVISSAKRIRCGITFRCWQGFLSCKLMRQKTSMHRKQRIPAISELSKSPGLQSRNLLRRK